MDHPDLIACGFMEIAICLKRVEKRVVLYCGAHVGSSSGSSVFSALASGA